MKPKKVALIAQKNDLSNSDKVTELSCRIAVIKIKGVLENSDLSDMECFQQIEEIVVSLENAGIDICGRHDF